MRINLYLYPSNVTRINGFYTCKIWNDLKNNADFNIYFPDKFMKHPPPKKYFWKVMSQIKTDIFDNYIKLALKQYKGMKRIDNENIIINEESLKLFDSFVKESLKLLGNINSKKATESRNHNKYDESQTKKRR